MYDLGRERCMISQRKQLRWFNPVYPPWWQYYKHLPCQVWPLYHTCRLECTCSHKHWAHLPAPSDTNLTNCHSILSTGHRHSPWPGPDIIIFPLPQTNHSRQTSASRLPGTQHSPFKAWEDAKQTARLQARSYDSHWIHSMATRSQKMDPKWKATMQYVMSSEEGDKLHSLKGHMAMCFHCSLLTESQSASVGHSQINSSNSLFTLRIKKLHH